MIDRNVQPDFVIPRHFEMQHPICFTLPNGVPMYQLHTPEAEVLRIDIVVPAGRWLQAQPLQALLTNRMLREGTRTYTEVQIAEALDYYGAWLELSCSAEWAFITMCTLHKYLPQTLDLLQSILMEPTFESHRVETIVQKNIQRFKINSRKVGVQSHWLLKSMLYGDRHPAGKLIDITHYQAINATLLKQFYQDYYHEKSASIYLSGNITSEVRERITRTLGVRHWGASAPSAHTMPAFDILPCPEKRMVRIMPDARQCSVRMGMLTIARNHPDYLKANVMLTLFGGYFGSRLMSNIREEKGYTYHISAGIMANPGHGMLMISAETTHNHVEPLIAEVYHEIDRIQTDLVKADELKRVQHYMLGEMCRNYESFLALNDAWIYIHSSRLPVTHFEDAFEAVRHITPDEIRDLAIRYLCKECLKEAIAGGKTS